MRSALFVGIAAAFLLLSAPEVYGVSAWLACAPFMYLRRDRRWRAACVTGVAFGLTTACCGHVPWVARTATLYFGLTPLSALGCTLVLAVVCGGAYGMALGLLLRCGLALPGVFAALGGSAAWVVWESVLVQSFPYYPWAGLAATQVDNAVILPAVRVMGSAGVSLAIALAGFGAGGAWQAWRTRMPFPTPWVSVVVAGILGPAASGVWSRSDVPMPSHCTVRLVDAGIVSGQVPPAGVLARYLELSGPPASDRVSLLVWPESALPGFIETDSKLRGQVRDLTARLAVPLIAGGPRRGWTATWHPLSFNSAFHVDPAGRIRSYDKQVLVPFAEYWPGWLGRRPAWLDTQEVDRGTRAAVFDAGACRAGVLVCFEAHQPVLAATLAERGASMLLVLSNDAQLAGAAVAAEVRHARLRAAETGVSVVRASNRGTSAVVDPSGRLVGRGQGATWTAAVPGPLPARFRLPPSVVVAGCVGILLLGALHTRRRPGLRDECGCPSGVLQ